MKQFNLEEYLKNPDREVVTRSGKPVRIICTDRKCPNEGYHIIALVENDKGNESVESYTKNGNWWGDGLNGNFDLFFAPNKHTDYINLYHSESGYYLGGTVFSSEEKAKGIAAESKYYLTTIKAEWEE